MNKHLGKQLTSMLASARPLIIAVAFCSFLPGGALRSQPFDPPPMPDFVKTKKPTNDEIARNQDQEKERRAWFFWVFRHSRELVMILVALLALVFGAAAAVKGLSYKKTAAPNVDQVRLEPKGATEPDQGQKGLSKPKKDLILTNTLNEKELIDQLGLPLHTFGPSIANMIAGVILFSGLAAGGVFGGYGILAYGQYSPGFSGSTLTVAGTIIMLALGVIFMIAVVWGAIVGLIWVKRTLSLRILVCPGGIIRIYRGMAMGVSWDQITEASVHIGASGTVRGNIDPTYNGIHDRVFALRREDGAAFEIHTYEVKDFSKMIEVISTYVPLK
jgi:hypothetical protein